MDDTGDKLDRILKHVDSFAQRLDALEGRKPELIDHGPIDEKAPEDVSETGDDLQNPPGKPSVEDNNAATRRHDAAMAEAQMRADRVASAHGESAPRPLSGEALMAYRARLARQWQRFSPEFKNVNLSAIKDAATFGGIESTIYADAMAASAHIEVPEGTLRETVTIDNSGRRISTFHGEPRAWMATFSGQRRRLTGIRNRTRD